jgi:hypothetical protein
VLSLCISTSQETEETSTPTRPADNERPTGKRNTQMLDGTMVEK